MTKGFYQHEMCRDTAIQVFHVEQKEGRLRVLVNWWNVAYGRPFPIGPKEYITIPIQDEMKWRRIPTI